MTSMFETVRVHCGCVVEVNLKVAMKIAAYGGRNVPCLIVRPCPRHRPLHVADHDCESWQYTPASELDLPIGLRHCRACGKLRCPGSGSASEGRHRMASWRTTEYVFSVPRILDRQESQHSSRSILGRGHAVVALQEL